MSEVVKELRLHAREASQKFEYAFLGLIFGSLALSVQFSTTRTESPVLLLFSWAFLFVSGVIGGWRMLYVPVQLRANMEVEDSKLALAALNRSLEMNEEALLLCGEFDEIKEAQDRVETQIKYEEARNKVGLETFEKLSDKIPKLLWYQVSAFLAGVLLNGIYAAVNLLARS